MGIYSLQHSSQQAEEALSQGLDQLQQSLIDTVSGGGSFNDGMHHMAVAMGKLTNLEGFVRQVCNLIESSFLFRFPLELLRSCLSFGLGHELTIDVC